MSKKRPPNVRVNTRTPIEDEEITEEFQLLEFLSEVFLKVLRYLRTEWFRTLELYTTLYTARYARLRSWVVRNRAPKVSHHRINLAHPQVAQKGSRTPPPPRMSRWQRAGSKLQEMILEIRTSPRWAASQKKATKIIPEIIIFGILLIISGWIVLSSKKAFLTIPWKLMWQPYWILATLVIIAIAWAAGKKWRTTHQIPWGLIGGAVGVVAIILFLNGNRDDPESRATADATVSTTHVTIFPADTIYDTVMADTAGSRSAEVRIPAGMNFLIAPEREETYAIRFKIPGGRDTTIVRHKDSEHEDLQIKTARFRLIAMESDSLPFTITKWR